MWESRGTGDLDVYTNNVIPQNLPKLKIHLVNYYDDYSFPGAASVASSGVTKSNQTKGLLTGTKVYLTDGTGGYRSSEFFTGTFNYML